MLSVGEMLPESFRRCCERTFHRSLAPAPGRAHRHGPAPYSARQAIGIRQPDRAAENDGVERAIEQRPLTSPPAAYIAGQLHAWRQGQRPPGPLGLMPAVATRLTDAEINAVSAYYAGQPKAADRLAAHAQPAARAKP